MRIETALCSCQGGRNYNEDSVRCLTGEGLCAAVVADGLGGHGGGQIASSAAADMIVTAFMEEPDTDPEYIRELFKRANAEVLGRQTPAQKMKSTGVGLFIRDGAAVWGHAGDSRLYHFTDGRLVCQTLDHSVSQMAVFSGEITSDGIRHHADRNRVLRAFGGGEEIKADIAPEIRPLPGFHAFLLCTDGFWEYVLETEMEAGLSGADTPDGWLEAMLKDLAGRAPEDSDNYSAIAVFLYIEGEEDGKKE